MPRDIPGFYYDAERNRYFRVQPNHAAGHGAQYSRQAVSDRKKRSKKQKIEHTAERRAQRQTIAHSVLLHHSLLGGHFLSKRLSDHGHRLGLRSDSRTLHFTQSLGASQLRSAGPSRHVSAALHDPVGDYLFTTESTTSTNFATTTTSLFVKPRHSPASRPSVAFSPSFPGRATSFCLNTISRTLLATCIDNPSIIRLHQISPLRDTSDLAMLSATGIDIQFSVPQASFWASQPSPADPMFVVGSSHSLYIAFAGESSWDLQRMKSRRNADFLSVDWLDRNAVIGGSRGGDVVFVDRRAGHDAMTRLVRDSAVSGVRKIQENLVAVRTLERLDVFDLRFTPHPGSARQQGSGLKNAKATTQPYRSFRGGRPYLQPTGSFDYEPTVGLLATVSDGPQPITLYSTQTFAPAPFPAPLTRDILPSSITDLRFTSVPGEAPSLLVAHDNIVEEWSFGGGGASESG